MSRRMKIVLVASLALATLSGLIILTTERELPHLGDIPVQHFSAIQGPTYIGISSPGPQGAANALAYLTANLPAPSSKGRLYLTTDVQQSIYYDTGSAVVSLVNCVNIQTYGADPKGVSDSTAAIQSAINAAQAANPAVAVYIPAGTYLLTAGLTTSATAPLLMRGDGKAVSILYVKGGSSVNKILTLSGSAASPNPTNNSIIQGVTFDGNFNLTTTNYGVYFNDQSFIRGVMRDCAIKDCRGNPGLGMTNADNCFGAVFDNVELSYNQIGVLMVRHCMSNCFLNCKIFNNIAYEMVLGDGTMNISDIRIVSGELENDNPGTNKHTNLLVNGVGALTVEGMYTEDDGVNTHSIEFMSLFPTVNTPTTVQTGGTLLDNTAYYYRISGLVNGNETAASVAVNVTTGNSGGNTNSNTVTWTAFNQSNAPAAITPSSYKIYRGTLVLGVPTYSTYFIVAGGGTTTWTDTGAAGTAGSLPGVSTYDSVTINGWYGNGAGLAPYWCVFPNDTSAVKFSARNLNLGGYATGLLQNPYATNKVIDLGPNYNQKYTPNASGNSQLSLPLFISNYWPSDGHGTGSTLSFTRADAGNCLTFQAADNSITGTTPAGNPWVVYDRNTGSVNCRVDWAGALHTPGGCTLGQNTQLRVAVASNPILQLLQIPSGGQTGDAIQGTDPNGNSYTFLDANFHPAPSFPNLPTVALGTGAGTGGAYSLGGISNAFVKAGGTGYAVNDTVTINGGTLDASSTRCVLTVTSVSAGVITGVSVTTPGGYTTCPANPATQLSSSGAGTGATFNLMPVCNDVAGTFTITPGTTPTASATVATFTFAKAYNGVPRVVILRPANAAAAALSGNGQVWVDYTSSGKTSFVIKVGSSALGTGPYQWSYYVIGCVFPVSLLRRRRREREMWYDMAA